MTGAVPLQMEQLALEKEKSLQVTSERCQSGELLSDALEDSDSAGRLKGWSLVRFLISSWGSILIGNALCSYPAVFSFTIQRHLEISSSLTALFLSVPSLLAFITYLLGPSVIDAFGVDRVYPAVSVVIIIAMLVMLLGYQLQSVWLMLPAVCFLRPLIGIVATSQMGVLACAVDRETYASLAGVGTSVVTLGYTIAFGLLPNIPQDKVLYVLLALSFIMALCNQHVACVARTGLFGTGLSDKPRATGRCFDKVSAMQRHLATNLSSTGLCGFPWKFWLVAMCGAFKASFYSFVDFQPYAFQRINGLDEALSNKIVSSVSIVVILVSPLAGQMFASSKRLHGPLLMAAAALLLAARTVAAFEFSVSLAWFEMIVTGAGQAFLAAGSTGLVPEVLAGREELLTCGNSYVAFLGQLFATITTQVCFMIFTGDEEVGQFDVTPGQFFMVFQGLALLMLTVAICRYAPLASNVSDEQDSGSELYEYEEAFLDADAEKAVEKAEKGICVSDDSRQSA